MRSFSFLLALSSLLALATLVRAGDEKAGCSVKDACNGKPGHGCHVVKCPQCCHDCVFSAEKAKQAHSCYTAECKPICIPRVVFPWQKGSCTCAKGDGKDGCCAIHNGVKKRSVRVLKKYEYECAHCKYQWTPVDYKNGYKNGDMRLKEVAPKAAPAGEVEVPPPPPVSAQHRPAHPDARIVVR